MKIIAFLPKLLALLCLLAFSLRSHGAVWHIDNAATGAGTGKTWEDAWTSWSQINWSSIRPGDEITISGGATGKSYSESFIYDVAAGKGRPGSFSSPVRVTTGKDPGHSGRVSLGSIELRSGAHNVVIDGLNSEGRQQFLLRGYCLIYSSTNVLIRGLEINRKDRYMQDANPTPGISALYNIKDVVIEDCHIEGTSGDGIVFSNQIYPISGYDHFVVRRCTILEVRDDGVQMGVPGGTVSDCTIDSYGLPALHGGHPDGVQLNPGNGYMKIHSNTIRNFNQNIFLEKVARNVFVWNNIIAKTNSLKNGTDRAILYSGNTNFPDKVLLIANNVFYGFDTYLAVRIDSASTSDVRATIANNIFMNSKVFYTGDSALLAPENLYYNSPEFSFWNDGKPSSGASTAFSQGIYSNPHFVDPSTLNFALQSDSPAKGAGLNLNEIFAEHDLGFQTPAWDIGLLTVPSPQQIPAKPSNLRVLRN